MTEIGPMPEDFSPEIAIRPEWPLLRCCRHEFMGYVFDVGYTTPEAGVDLTYYDAALRSVVWEMRERLRAGDIEHVRTHTDLLATPQEKS